VATLYNIITEKKRKKDIYDYSKYKMRNALLMDVITI